MENIIDSCKNKIEQENLCLQTRFLIDKLRTNLILLDLPNKSYNERDLKKLKSKVNQYFWSL